MNELAIAKIDADMAERAAHGVEEHQIARTQILLVDHLGGFGLFLGNARQSQAFDLLINGAHETAAIKTTFCTVAAATVGDSDESHGGRHKFTRAIRHAVAYVLELGNQATFGQHALHVISAGIVWSGERNIRER